MSRFNKPQSRTWKNYLLQALFIVVTTLIIVWLLPHGDNVTLHLEKGKPWPHGRLIAPYDFPILKPDTVIQKERDSIQRAFEPYFEMLPEVEEKQLTALRAAFQSQTGADLPLVYYSFLEEGLHEVYSKGIVDVNDLQVLQLQNTVSVIVYKGNEAITVPIGQLYTEKSAYEHLFANLDSHQLSRQKLQRLDLNRYLWPNLSYDEGKSKERWEEMERSLIPSSGVVVAGQNIIDRGDIITDQTIQILNSYIKAKNDHNVSKKAGYLMLVGQLLYVCVILFCLVVYFNLFRQDYLVSVRSILLIWVALLTYPLITSILVHHNWLSVYLIPYAMLPLFIRVFMDSRTAFITHVATILLCALSLRSPFEFIATQVTAGLVAIYSMREMSERSQIIRMASMVTLSALLVYLSMDFTHGRSFLGDDAMTRVDYSYYIYITLSGVLLLFAYPLMALLERLFGFTSNVTLVELSNINRPLLRSLSETAPGTFQHSMQVANLAAEVANKIGAKAQLVRTGALYHDIGKMNNPEYYTENQLGGVNPHKMLSNKDSAAIILRHIVDGEEMADRFQLPRVIRDFISTHHGRGVAKYFFISEKNEHPDENIDIADYTYKGPNPSTTEQAILMMVDAVEATARSLTEYTEESIGQLVDRTIDGQVADGFFTECPITFRDIYTAKEVLKEKLKTIYHTRVSYPTLKTDKQLPVQETGSTSK